MDCYQDAADPDEYKDNIFIVAGVMLGLFAAYVVFDKFYIRYKYYKEQQELAKGWVSINWFLIFCILLLLEYEIHAEKIKKHWKIFTFIIIKVPKRCIF